MASRYLKASGLWESDLSWSATDGGVAGATFPVAGDNVFLTANANGLTVTCVLPPECDSLVCSGGCTATIAGTQTITVGGNVTLLSTMTVLNTITFTVTGTGNFAGSTLATLGTINLTGSVHAVSGAFTCVNLTRHPTSHAATDTLTMTSGTTVTVTGTFTCDGGARATQLLVQSSTLGTAATISAAAVSIANTDFMDITGAGAATWDLSAQTDVGNCQGNAFKALGDAAFPAAAAQTYTDAGDHKWSTAANWTSRVPLPQDNVAVSATITVDMRRLGANVVFSGAPVVTVTVTRMYNFGNLTFTAGMTYTHNSRPNDMGGRGVTTLTTNGISLYKLGVYTVTGTVTTVGALTLTNNINLQGGGITLGGNVSCNNISPDAGAGVTPTLTLGSYTVTMTNTSDAFVPNLNTNMVLNAGTSTLIVSRSNANAFSFIGRTFTFYNVTFTGAGAYAVTLPSSITFNTLTIDASAAAKTLTGTAGTTQTVRNLVAKGSPGKVIIINSTGAAWTIQGNNVYFEGDYLNLTNVITPNKYTYYAGTHSTDGGGNTNWIFSNKIRPTMKCVVKGVGVV